MNKLIQQAQYWLNKTYHSHSEYKMISEDGNANLQFIYALIKALQMELELENKNGLFETKAEKAFKEKFGIVSIESDCAENSNINAIIQIALLCNGYSKDTDTISTLFDKNMEIAIRQYQQDFKLKVQSGVVDYETLKKLLFLHKFPQEMDFETEIPGQGTAAKLLAASDDVEFSYAKNYLESLPTYSPDKNDAIVLQTGTMTHTITDFTLPGRNGFDLSITRNYASEDANMQDVKPILVDTIHIPILNQTYYIYGTGGRDNDHYRKTYGLGYGWSLRLPSIETIPVNFSLVNGPTQQTLLHLEDGRSFAIDEATFSSYRLKDIQLEKTTAKTLSHPYASISKTYNFVVKYKNGNKDYFYSTYNSTDKAYYYKLVGRQDRFGNTMCFTIQDYGGMEIIDTWGRSVKLVKSGTTLTWTLPDNSTIKYLVDSSSKPNKILQVTDQETRTTKYGYYDQNKFKGVCKYDHVYHDGSVLNVSYMLLSKIEYPTQMSTEFQYGTNENSGAFKVKVGLLGYKEFYPLYSRKDIVNSNIYNVEKFSYTTASIFEKMATVTIQKANNTVECYTFSYKIGDTDYCSSQVQEKNIYNDGVIHTKCGYVYDTNSLIIRDITEFYNKDTGDSLQKITEWTYTEDGKADIASIKETYPDNPQYNQTTQMKYGTHSQLIEKSYKKDDSTTITEKYALLSPNNNVVEYERIYANNVLKEKKQYVYGTGTVNKNCVIQQRQYYTQNTAEDLERSSAYYTTKYEYDHTQYTHAPVSIEQSDVVDADGFSSVPVEKFAYDVCGRLISSTDANKHTTTTEYDKLGRTVKETFPAVNGETAFRNYSYNDALNYTIAINENGYKSRTEFTPFGQVEKEYLIDRQGNQENDILLKKHIYDEIGRVTTEKVYDGMGTGENNVKCTTQYTYDSFNRILSKTIPIINYLETNIYDDVYTDFTEGVAKVYKKQTIIKGSGKGCPDLTTVTYTDQLGNVTKEIAGGATVADYIYDKSGNVVRKTDASKRTIFYTYDYAGRLLDTSYMLNRKMHKISVVYDCFGNKKYEIDASGHKTEYVYDALGRFIKKIVPFDTRNQTTKYYYDLSGNLICEKNDLGNNKWRVNEYKYDERGRQTDIIVYENDTRSKWNRTEMVYDAAGNVLETRTGYTESDTDYRTVSCTYNQHGAVLTFRDSLGKEEKFEYDNTGLLTHKTDRMGNVFTYVYDPIDRLIKQTSIDKISNSISEKEYAYYPTGKKARESNRVHGNGLDIKELSIQYRYDRAGRLILQEDPDEFYKLYSYDHSDNLIAFNTKSKNKDTDIHLMYTYDEMNRLKKVSRKPNVSLSRITCGALNLSWQPVKLINNDTPHATLRIMAGALNLSWQPTKSIKKDIVVEYSYDDNGNRHTMNYPDKDILVSYGYNKANLPISVENRKGNDLLLSSYCYEYNLDGSKSRSADNNSSVKSYAYDYIGRLTNETDTQEDQLIFDKKYEYDRFSNRSKMTVNGTENYTVNYTYDNNNQIVQDAQTNSKNETTVQHYINDENGNTTGIRDKNEKHLIDFQYNAQNQLIRVLKDEHITNYEYRPDSLRYSKQFDDVLTQYQWNDGHIIAEKVNDGICNKYWRGIDLVACQTQKNEDYHYLFNAHGDVVQLMNADTSIQAMQDYDAFGNMKNSIENSQNPFWYCGEFYDVESENYYIRARYYNPHTGNWTTEDPARDGLNWRHYCNNDPVNYHDSTGNSMTAILIGLGVGAAMGGIFGGLGAAAGGDHIGWGIVGGAAVGMLTGVSGIFGGVGTGVFIGAAASGANTMLQGHINNNFAWGNVAASAIVGGVTGGVGNALGNPFGNLSGTSNLIAYGITEGVKELFISVPTMPVEFVLGDSFNKAMSNAKRIGGQITSINIKIPSSNIPNIGKFNIPDYKTYVVIPPNPTTPYIRNLHNNLNNMNSIKNHVLKNVSSMRDITIPKFTIPHINISQVNYNKPTFSFSKTLSYLR